MDFRLIDRGWDRELANAVRTDHSELRVICPFIKLRSVERLLKNGTPQPIQVITRFSLADFCSGVSDTEALRLLLKHGAQVRGVHGLHAKLYLFGNSRVILTSANLTESALKRNHEIGFVADDGAIVARCRRYFDDLWKRSGTDLKLDRVLSWEDTLEKCLAGGARPTGFAGLSDEGVRIDLGSEPGPVEGWVSEAPQEFVKFFGTSSNRADRALPVLVEVQKSGSHWACTYPKGKRPRRIQDGAVIFIGRMVKHPDDVIVYGRAVAMRHVPGRDDATEADMANRPWKEKWPHYIRVHHAEFVAGELSNGVSLNALMEALGYQTFATTSRHAAQRKGNTVPRLAYRRLPDVELAEEGASWLNERFDQAINLYGRVPASELAKLDWPEVPAAGGNKVAVTTGSSSLGPKGRKLLKILVKEIRKGRVRADDPTTFVSYSEALELLGVPPPYTYAGRRLQSKGLSELNEWTKMSPVPKVAGLIVNKKTHNPGLGYARSHDISSGWKVWWLDEAKKSVQFDWTPYL